MRANGWRVELMLTARVIFSSNSSGETFDRAIPLWVRFPREIFPAPAVEDKLKIWGSPSVFEFKGVNKGGEQMEGG